MHRIDTETAGADVNGTGKNGFVDGVPPGVPSTRLNAAFCNALQEEPASVVEGKGYALEKTNKQQMIIALELEVIAQMLATRVGQVDVGATIVGMAASSSYPRVVPAIAGSQLGPVLVFVGTNMFKWVAGGLYSAINDETVTADLQSVAIKHLTAVPVAVAVGDAGKWVRASISAIDDASITTGTVGGGPTLTGIFFDKVNSLWWAYGPDGVFKAADAGALAWTQVSNVEHSAGCVLASGRVLFWRPSVTQVWYTDNLTALTAGLVEADGKSVWYEPSTDNALILTDTGWLNTVDGVVAGVEATGFGPGGAFNELRGFLRVRGRTLVAIANNGLDFHHAFYACKKPALSNNPADWVYVHGSTSVSVKEYVACGELVLERDLDDGTLANVSHRVPDITGVLSAA